MEAVEIIAEVLKYVAPVAVLLIVVKYMNDQQMERLKAEHQRLVRSEVLRAHLPLRLTAYERAVLFLERISPEHLLPRIPVQGKTAAAYHQELVREIQTEYEHNLAQQIYISVGGWAALVRAKDEIHNLLNTSLSEVGREAEAILLVRKIFEICSTTELLPTQKAANVLKADIQVYFQP
ncbi:MAG: hypothetical protein D6722_07655 [Bacteroidetes bacterium]|nr:MAG: hypothetical protein D6722_07655 [Bacteroidota bacterium]